MTRILAQRAVAILGALLTLLVVIELGRAADPDPCDSECRRREVIYDSKAKKYTLYVPSVCHFCVRPNLQVVTLCKPRPDDENTGGGCTVGAGDELASKSYPVMSEGLCEFSPPPITPQTYIESKVKPIPPNVVGVDEPLSKCKPRMDPAPDPTPI